MHHKQAIDAIKAFHVTQDTILVVDKNHVNPKVIESRQMPSCLVILVDGPVDKFVQELSRKKLKELLGKYL